MGRPAYILTASCADKVGIVAAVSGFLAKRGALLTELSHFVDEQAQKSFIRTRFEDDAETREAAASLAGDFQETVAGRFDMPFEVHPAERPIPTLLACSRQSHCLNALLHRWASGHLPIDIRGVVSNHDENRSLVEWHGLPFHHLPILGGDKAAQEARLIDLYETTDSELLVLARYMQILTSKACERLAGRAINIHHSFLPGFKGARPYHQAFDRGVKLIGATAHYVTTELDEGPIIEQDATRVNHAMNAEELVRLGQDIECTVLNRAVRWHAEHRVFLNGRRTVVLQG